MVDATKPIVKRRFSDATAALIMARRSSILPSN